MVIDSTFSLGHFHGSNINPFGQTINSRSNSSAHHTSTRFGGSAFSGKQSSPFGITSGQQCRGSAVASYSATWDVDEKINSISAMPVYKNKSHEELRLQDYELHKGFTFSVPNQRNAFQQSNSPFCITSASSSWSTSASVGSILPGPKSTSGFHFSMTTAASSNSSIFGIQTSSGSQCTTTIESTVSKQSKGSGVASYSATREVGSANNRYDFESIQSISAMPIYKDKSHEELRLEDYQLCNKGGQTRHGGQFLSPSLSKSSDTPANIFPSLFNQSSLNSPFQPFKSNLFVPKIGNFNTPNNTISTVPTLSPSANPFSFTNLSPNNTISTASTLSPSTNPFPCTNLSSNNTISTAPIPTPSVNPFSFTNLYPSQSQASIPQPTAVCSMPAFTQNLINQCPKISMRLTSPSVETFSSSKPSFTLSPSIQSTSVTALDSWPFIPSASHLGQAAEKVDSVSASDQSQPAQSSNGLTTVKEFSSQNINGQQYVPSSTLGVQSSLVVNPFPAGSPTDQPNAVTSRQYGISSLPVSNNLSSNRRTSLLRLRHVSGHPSLPAQRPSCGSCETKVPFFIDDEDKPDPIAPFLPRENPRAWGKDYEDNENSTALTNETSVQEEDLSATLSRHQEYVHTVTEKHEADVLAIMPKLPDGEYYTEPSIKELAAKEMAEPGWCSHVIDFVVGRWGYGSIKFLGETDVRHLHLESIVQFNNREVIVYQDDRKQPPVGQSLNKPSEVTILNAKCISKKTGKQYVEGPQVYNYKEMLVKNTSEQRAEFVSYDPVQGEWKFRVQHF